MPNRASCEALIKTPGGYLPLPSFFLPAILPPSPLRLQNYVTHVTSMCLPSSPSLASFYSFPSLISVPSFQSFPSFPGFPSLHSLPSSPSFPSLRSYPSFSSFPSFFSYPNTSSPSYCALKTFKKQQRTDMATEVFRHAEMSQRCICAKGYQSRLLISLKTYRMVY